VSEIYNIATIPDDLKEYFVRAEIGLEPTLGEHLEKIVEVFAEVWRVLKPTGTVWLNYGDCYATTPAGHKADADGRIRTGKDDRTFTQKPFSTIGAIYNPGGHGGNRTKSKSKSKINGKIKDGVLSKGRIEAGAILKPKDLCMIPNRLAIALQEWGWGEEYTNGEFRNLRNV